MQNTPHSDCALTRDTHRVHLATQTQPRVHQLTPNAILLTYHEGEIGQNLEEHFSRSLAKPNVKDPTTTRSYPPSFWNKNYSRRPMAPPAPPPLQPRFPARPEPQQMQYGPPPPLLRPGSSWGPVGANMAHTRQDMNPAWPRYPTSSYPTILDIGQRCSGSGYGNSSGFRANEWAPGFGNSVDPLTGTPTMPAPGYPGFGSGLDCSMPPVQDCLLQSNTWSNFM